MRARRRAGRARARRRGSRVQPQRSSPPGPGSGLDRRLALVGGLHVRVVEPQRDSIAIGRQLRLPGHGSTIRRISSAAAGTRATGIRRPDPDVDRADGDRLVPHTGFEPVISALRGRCPGPLDECGPVGAGGVAGPVGMIPAERRAGRTTARRAPGGDRYSRFVSRNAADRLGDLLVAALADDQAVVRVRAERLVVRVEPLGQPLRRRLSGTSGRARRRSRAAGRLGSAAPVDRHARRASGAGPRPASCGFWPSRCWIRSTSASVRSRWSRSRLLGQRLPADAARVP